MFVIRNGPEPVLTDTVFAPAAFKSNLSHMPELKFSGPSLLNVPVWTGMNELTGCLSVAVRERCMGSDSTFLVIFPHRWSKHSTRGMNAILSECAHEEMHMSALSPVFLSAAVWVSRLMLLDPIWSYPGSYTGGHILHNMTRLACYVNRRMCNSQCAGWCSVAL